MISQADIIKTLINKNCTDESIMATALSPDCTTYRLMMKLTEAERFDLALDVSMKLGIDVAPLWRTWAMRCLKNRNFQGAREKFRQCFMRINTPGRKHKGIVQNLLLSDILNELSHMDDKQLSLSEQIVFIKQRQVIPRTKEPLKSRTKIYEECLFYLNVYGTIEDAVIFYVKNNLWDETADLFRGKCTKTLAKFFVDQIFPDVLTRGRLKDFMEALVSKGLPPDSHLNICLVELYKFCTINRRCNTLCYIQTSIGDLMSATETQINLIFLQKPFLDYRELNGRITNLIQAASSIRQYMDRLKGGENLVRLGRDYSLTEAEHLLRLVEIQIEITRNFAINEVSGCPYGLEYVVDDKGCKSGALGDTPVTLFDENEVRRTFLAALVLIYFDLSCSTYFSKSGLELANKIVQIFGLDKLRVFKAAMRIIIEDESCDILENANLLLERLKEDYTINEAKSGKGHESSGDTNKRAVKGKGTSNQVSSSNQTGRGLVTTKRPSVVSLHSAGAQAQTPSTLGKLVVPDVRAICDEVIRDSIGNCREADYKMELAKLLSSEARIKLYIEHGKLSNAQRLAFNMNRPDYVSLIIEEAERLNQDHVKTVCQLWLAKHETRNSRR